MLTFKVTLRDTVYLSRFTNVHSLLTNKRCKVKVNDTLETYRYYTDFTNYTYIHTYTDIIQCEVEVEGVIEGRREVHTSLAPPSAVTSCNPQSDWNINII